MSLRKKSVVPEHLSHNQLARTISRHTTIEHGFSIESQIPSREGMLPLKQVPASDKVAQAIGVFTSGGDSCGMNSAVRAVIRMGIYLRFRMFFIREGYKGMIEDVDGNYIEPADWISVSGIIEQGGTVIGSARSKEFRERPGRLKAAKNLVKNGISNLVCIGGDGSLTGANLFRNEWPSLLQELVDTNQITVEQQTACAHLHVVGMVGSIDNDFCGTDMTIGTDSALHRIQESIDAIVTTASSHQRTFILEIMGRHCGYLALVAAITSEADFVFIPEDPPQDGWEDKMCDKLKKERDQGQRLNIILVAEGAIDRSGKPITAQQVCDVVVKKLGQDARVTILGHVQRGGSPSAFDRILGCRMGAEAVMALRESTPETPACVISLVGNQAVRVDLMKCVKLTQDVAAAMKARNFELAVKLRGRSFQRNLETYRMLTEIAPPEGKVELAGFRIAVICIGAPACGMNAAIRSFVRNILYRGGSVLAVGEGIDGLIEGSIRELEWTEVNGLTFQAGTGIGTRRTICSDPEVLKKVADQLKHFRIHGLLGIGGFECFHCFFQLAKGRKEHESLRIPLCIIPATISNNVPGSDFSIGADTAVNEISEICDRIRKSAEGTKRRVFVIETMGGYCGYLATMAGLAGGADAAYIFEEKYGVSDLKADVDHMMAKMSEGVTRGLILNNENSNPHYKTDFIFRLFAEEGKEVFSTRVNVLGHMQQGASPSPFDRNLGTKLAARASTWIYDILESNCNTVQNFSYSFNDEHSAVLLGLTGRQYQFRSLQSLEPHTDFKHRKAKEQWYMILRPLLRILARHESKYKRQALVSDPDSTSDLDF